MQNDDTFILQSLNKQKGHDYLQIEFGFGLNIVLGLVLSLKLIMILKQMLLSKSL